MSVLFVVMVKCNLHNFFFLFNDKKIIQFLCILCILLEIIIFFIMTMMMMSIIIVGGLVSICLFVVIGINKNLHFICNCLQIVDIKLYSIKQTCSINFFFYLFIIKCVCSL